MRINLLLLVFIFPAVLSARENPKNDTAIICLVADKILSEHTYEIINRKTTECYVDTKGLPLGKEYQVKSRYLEWRYVNGVLNMAMLHLGEAVDGKKYTDFVLNNYRFLFANKPYFQKQYDAGIWDYGYGRFLRMGSLDDCGAMTAALVEANRIDPHDEYGKYIDKTADYIMNGQSRLPDGIFSRGSAEHSTVWLDDLYMSVSFLANRGAYYNDTAALNTAARQVVKFTRLLYDINERLYFHCYYDYLKEPGVAHWSRANGWCIFAQSMLLSAIPENHPMREELLRIFRQQVNGFARYQDKSGMWHQLLDKPDSYLETSTTAMFAYAVAKGVNNGWLEKDYASIALRAWEGIKMYITYNGEVKNICKGTGISHDLVFYYERPTPLNDVHGLGAVIDAGLEILKLKDGVGK